MHFIMFGGHVKSQKVLEADIVTNTEDLKKLISN